MLHISQYGLRKFEFQIVVIVVYNFVGVYFEFGWMDSCHIFTECYIYDGVDSSFWGLAGVRYIIS